MSRMAYFDRMKLSAALLALMLLTTPARADEEANAPWLGDLIRVRFERGGPVVYTTLRSTSADGEATALRVKGQDRLGDLSIVILGGVDADPDAAGSGRGVANDGRRAGEVIPERLTLRCVRNAGEQAVATEISWQRFGLAGTDFAAAPRTLDVSQSIQGTGEHRFIRLIRLHVQHDPAAFVQTSSAAGGGAKVLADGQDWPVRFTVNEVGGTGQAPVNVNAVAATFADLRLRNGRDVERFLRPLFSATGQEAVFAPDPVAAFQVFAGRWTADPASRARVEALVPALASGDFRDRERATRQLRELGRPAVEALLKLDRSTLSAEQCLRAESVMRPFLSLPPAQAERLRQDRSFLLDCLSGDDPTVRAAAWDRLKELAPAETAATAYNPDADPAARSAAAAELRGRLLPTASEK